MQNPPCRAVFNAHKTLTVIMAILGLFLLGLGYLCPAYHIGAMNELKPGYQNVLSQLVAAVAGRNVFYYVSLASIFIVLTYSAQTSFADFPRVCRFLAEDRFLPPAFAQRGRRLVFSHGIVILMVFSGALLAMFGGITDKLIPLFAVGAFGAFLFSQAGMVKHWLRKRGPRFRSKLLYNAIGAVIMSNDITAVYVETEPGDGEHLREMWKDKVEQPVAATHSVPPRLEILGSPYRQISPPIVDFVKRVANEKRDRLVAVVIPELVEPHWYEFLLHSFHGERLRARLFLDGDERIVVVSTPCHLHDQ